MGLGGAGPSPLGETRGRWWERAAEPPPPGARGSPAARGKAGSGPQGPRRASPGQRAVREGGDSSGPVGPVGSRRLRSRGYLPATLSLLAVRLGDRGSPSALL